MQEGELEDPVGYRIAKQAAFKRSFFQEIPQHCYLSLNQGTPKATDASLYIS
jgi:hypothetical protein